MARPWNTGKLQWLLCLVLPQQDPTALLCPLRTMLSRRCRRRQHYLTVRQTLERTIRYQGSLSKQSVCLQGRRALLTHKSLQFCVFLRSPIGVVVRSHTVLLALSQNYLAYSGRTPSVATPVLHLLQRRLIVGFYLQEHQLLLSGPGGLAVFSVVQPIHWCP